MKKVHPEILSSNKTMTVKELKKILRKYPGGLPVIAIWEGVGAGFRKENFDIQLRKGRKELWIDVENYG